MFKNAEIQQKYMFARSWTFNENICFRDTMPNEKSPSEKNGNSVIKWSAFVTYSVMQIKVNIMASLMWNDTWINIYKRFVHVFFKLK